ncbi:hypothetical protein NLX83_37600 [Allokutzneria sp. A3M-2-11 16]|uniref:hypothetical protein n=1 Tax=Allokutzneria sp. A3M-2-11 16 TaxID=2962043 RepID=UPI0020B676E2|nr:hypothetical protein [Allokutzneria sp. A3M-2-11 16]MCP3804998.1 hypothetical protein [Allokutzneria sp. A3M-2-11 16]
MRSSIAARITVSALLAAGLAACGGGGGGVVNQSAVVAKMKTEAESKDLPQAALECVADVMIKHYSKDDIQAWLDGRKKSGEIKGTKEVEAAATKELEEKCSGKIAQR